MKRYIVISWCKQRILSVRNCGIAGSIVRFLRPAIKQRPAPNGTGPILSITANPSRGKVLKPQREPLLPPLQEQPLQQLQQPQPQPLQEPRQPSCQQPSLQ